MFESPDVAAVRERLAGMRDLVGRLEPDAVPSSEAAAMWQAFDGIERLAASAKTLLAARVAESDVWQRAGDRSAPEYLARRSGSSLGAARSSLETSKRIRTLPHTRSAMRRGELSRAQADEIAAAASANQGAEGSLLNSAAGATLPELRERCARTKAAADPDGDATRRRIHRERRLRRWTDAGGAWNLHARGTPVPADGEAAAAAATLASARPSATDAPSRATPARPAERPVNPTHLALLRIDLEALVRGRVEGDELCEIAGIGAISVPAARDLLGESIVKLVITNGIDVANVTHLGRGPTAAQRIALLWSSPCCDVRGCSSTIGVEADHRLPWADDQVTELPNLDRLCGHHHYLKSHHGWALVPGTGKRPMVPPGDPRHPVDRSRDPACDDPSPKRTVGPAVDREVATEPEDSKPPGPPTRASPRFGDAA